MQRRRGLVNEQREALRATFAAGGLIRGSSRANQWRGGRNQQHCRREAAFAAGRQLRGQPFSTSGVLILERFEDAASCGCSGCRTTRTGFVFLTRTTAEEKGLEDDDGVKELDEMTPR